MIRKLNNLIIGLSVLIVSALKIVAYRDLHKYLFDDAIQSSILFLTLSDLSFISLVIFILLVANNRMENANDN